MKERKTSAPDLPCFAWWTSFNGAAPVKERKTSTTSAVALYQCRLQWGRSGEGAEDLAPCHCLGRGGVASMGPLR